VAEMQFADFVSCGFSQLVNNAGTFHYRLGVSVPMVVRLPSGHVLRAETLRWNRRAGELTSDHAVSIAGPRIEVTGTGLVVRPATQEFTVLGGVRANVF